jgi:hypothetical protein
MFGDLDGQGYKQLMAKEYMHTMTIAKTGGAMVNHARIGIYRNPRIQGTASIYFDGFTIATDQASAEQGAFGAVPPPAATPTPAPAATPQGPVAPVRTGNPSTGSSPTTSAPATPTTSTKKRARRVVLRSKHRRRATVRSSGHWPRILPVYGWVKANGDVGRRAVIIEIRVHGRWEKVSRGWLRKDGRFYLAPSVDPDLPHRVTLRAYVEGIGYSKALKARV